MTELHRNPGIEYSDAVDVLCRPHTVTITGPDGAHLGHRLTAPLLQTLAANVAAGVMRGGGAGEQPHARTPLNIGAADLLSAIRSSVLRDYAEQVGGGARPDVIPALIAVRLPVLNEWRAGKISEGALDGRTARLTRWAQAIGDLLDPPMRIELTDPCPRCGDRWVAPREGDREGDSTPALSTTYRDVDAALTQCSSCGAQWLGIEGARALRTELDRAAYLRAVLLGAG